MADKPLDLTVELAPKARFDFVNLRDQFADEHAALAIRRPFTGPATPRPDS
jgi:hypothetical protein